MTINVFFLIKYHYFFCSCEHNERHVMIEYTCTKIDIETSIGIGDLGLAFLMSTLHTPGDLPNTLIAKVLDVEPRAHSNVMFWMRCGIIAGEVIKEKTATVLYDNAITVKKQPPEEERYQEPFEFI